MSLHFYKKKLNKLKSIDFSWTHQRSEDAEWNVTLKSRKTGKSSKVQPRPFFTWSHDRKKHWNSNSDKLLEAEGGLAWGWETPWLPVFEEDPKFQDPATSPGSHGEKLFIALAGEESWSRDMRRNFTVTSPGQTTRPGPYMSCEGHHPDSGYLYAAGHT